MLKYLFCFLLSSFMAYSQSAQLDSVKLFTNGSELYHTVNFDLSAGENEIIINNISSEILDNSIRIIEKGDFFIQTIEKITDYIDSFDPVPIQDSIDYFNDQIDLLNVEYKTLEAELLLIKSTVNLGGSEQREIKPSDIIELTKLYQDRLPKINKMILKVNKEIKLYQKKIEEYQNQLNNGQITGEYKSKIKLIINSNTNSRSKISFSYLSYLAWWKARYDFKFNSTGNSEVIYKADIYNTTNLDWKNIPIAFSSKYYEENLEVPVITANYIRLNKVYESTLTDVSFFNSSESSPLMPSEAKQGRFKRNKIAKTEYRVNVSDNSFESEFELKPNMKFSIESGSKSKLFSIMKKSLIAEYEWMTIPSKSKLVFLTAKINDYWDLKLLNAPVNIYLDNSFINTTILQTDVTKDFINLSLGVDKNISVERKLLTDFSEDRFFSGNIKRSFGVEIIIRNKKSRKIDLVIKDQVPVSTTDEIEVEIIEDGLNTKLDEFGILEWNVSIDAKADFSQKFYYNVSWPKDEVIYSPIGFIKR